MPEAGELLFMQNENYSLVDALPYIDTQLGSMQVAEEVKKLIDQEMGTFEAKDYLAALPLQTFPYLETEAMQAEFARIEARMPFRGIDVEHYTVTEPKGALAKDAAAWRKATQAAEMQLEHNRLRLVNLEMLERWGNKAWIAHSAVIRATEGILAKETSELRATREEVNKKRKLDHVTCGNELRRLALELDQYRVDNQVAEEGLVAMEREVRRLRACAEERNVNIDDVDPEYATAKRQRTQENGDAKKEE